MASILGARKRTAFLDFKGAMPAVALLLLAFLGMFYYGPIGSLLSQGIVAPGRRAIDFDAYRTVFASSHLQMVILRTFALSFLISLVTILVAYPIAYLVASERPMVSRLLLTLVLIPLWTSLLVRTYAWQVIFQSRGVLNSALMAMGLIGKPLDLLYTPFSVVVSSVHILVPFAVLPIIGSLRKIDASLLRAGTGLGATPRQVFIAVVLPLSLPGVCAAAVMVFIMSLGFFVTPAILGGGKVIVLAMEIQRYVGSLLDWRTAAVLSTILLSGTILLLGLLRSILRRAGLM